MKRATSRSRSPSRTAKSSNKDSFEEATSTSSRATKSPSKTSTRKTSTRQQQHEDDSVSVKSPAARGNQHQQQQHQKRDYKFPVGDYPNLDTIVVVAIFSLCLYFFYQFWLQEQGTPIFKVPNVQERIAIVGAGIGGSSVSYYLRDFLNQQLRPINGNANSLVLDVYEKRSRIGGRIKDIVFHDFRIELGADAWVSDNVELMNLIAQVENENMTQISKKSERGNGIFGVWNGTNDWKNVSLGLNLATLNFKFHWEWNRYYLYINYLRRRFWNTFETLEEFTELGNLKSLTSISGYDWVKKFRIAPEIVETFWDPLNRLIFDQHLDENAFAALATLKSTGTSYNILQGNVKLVELLLEKARVNLAKEAVVTEIEALSNGKYILSYSKGNLTTKKEYDFVILATPLELAKIKFKNMPIAENVQMRKYVTWHVYAILADGLSPKYFGIDPVPDVVLTATNSTVRIHTVNIRHINNETGKRIYKIFSNEFLTEEELRSMFINLTDTQAQHWDGVFPIMKPLKEGESYQPIRLHNHMYYINTIESLATAMGGTMITSENIAKLVVKDIHKKLHPTPSS